MFEIDLKQSLSKQILTSAPLQQKRLKKQQLKNKKNPIFIIPNFSVLQILQI